MAYKFKYNERPRSYSEEKHGDEDIPSAKAVRDTAVEERDGKIIKSRRQHVCGREYIVFAEFSFGGTQSTVDLYETGHRPGAGRKKYFRLKNRFA